MTRRNSLTAIACLLTASSLLGGELALASAQPPRVHERVFEWTIESRKVYADPFNDVDVDVIFTSGAQSWRVPTFWRGGSKWTVRFAPPSPGQYAYHIESSDKINPDLNGHEGKVTITAYSGDNPLLKHGMLRVAPERRSFQHADGTPFYWLGDTWWSGLSDRLSWTDFQELAADRKEKGFTVVQMVAGLVPFEEVAPTDPGFRNEGGPVWDSDFNQINPRYFDYADRRVQHLIELGIVPAIVGAWRPALERMNIVKIKKHWRYIIARYGAYPVIWIAGGELFDAPADIEQRLSATPWFSYLKSSGWTEVVRYIRTADPYHHPLSAHEIDPPYDSPVQDESLTDFDFFQAGHRGWPSVATEVALLNTHYARTEITKPLVVGEIGYEGLGATHLEDFQRTAFWLAMLNGAAGYSYGAVGTWQAYSADEPIHRVKFSFVTWREGMNFPGSRQIGMGARLLRQYPWWKFKPRPDWVTPRGTTLLKPRKGVYGFDIDLLAALTQHDPPPPDELPLGEWHNSRGNFRLPYAAGIDREVRFIYMPYFGFEPREPPTVLNLEEDVRYHAFYWDTSLGIKFDLGIVERPATRSVIYKSRFDKQSDGWLIHGGGEIAGGRLVARQGMIAVNSKYVETNVIVAVNASSRAGAGLLLRYQNKDNYLAAMYSPEQKSLFLRERQGGIDGALLGVTAVESLGLKARLTAEVRNGMAIAAISDGERTYTTPIVAIRNRSAGMTGIMHENSDGTQTFDNFLLCRSPPVVHDDALERRLYDGQGRYRGQLSGQGVAGVQGWDQFGKEKHLLLNAYRPPQLPYGRDWLLVLERERKQ